MPIKDSHNARQRQLGRSLRKMLQHRALHLHKSAFAVRMHHFHDEFPSVRGAQMEIVVVLARKRMRGGSYSEEPPRNFRCFRFCDGFSYRRFAHLAQKCSGKSFLRPFSAAYKPLSTQSTEIGPFTVDTCTSVGPLPNSTRFLSSSHVLRPSEQTLAPQWNGLWPFDSITTPD